MELRQLKALTTNNPYLRLGTEVSELEKSISSLGLIAPLVISTNNTILAGARRYQAISNLGWTEAPVMVVDLSTLEQELVSIDENLVRKDLSKIEIESHLRRAKEIYQVLNPAPEVIEEELSQGSEDEPAQIKKVTLPAQKFLEMVSEKTGLSPKQIHEAINRDEMASPQVKEARLKGELSLSQTNEIVKLSKDDQLIALNHVKELPVREIKKFVKLAKTQGVHEAITATPNEPHQKDFMEIDSGLKKLLKKLKQLQMEGITLSIYPESTQKLFQDLMKLTDDHHFNYELNHEESNSLQ